MRECPVAGRAIEGFECATARHTKYACPESCPFNVFAVASYPKFQAIERSADEKYFAWVMGHATDRAQLESDMLQLGRSGPNQVLLHRMAWHGIYRVGPGGETCIGEWAKAGFPGLGTDERVVMRSRMKQYPAMLEVHRILDNSRVEAVDLLEPERGPFIVLDTDFAREVVRFEVYGGHFSDLPHYSRLQGPCVVIPGFDSFTPEQVIHELIRHLGGPVDNPGRRLWLTRHFERFDQALGAVALARQQATNAGKFDPALVPPALLSDTPELVLTTNRDKVPSRAIPDTVAAAGIICNREQGILDQPIPLLDSQTPRAAALDPALRPKLLQWMKFWISQTDRHNLETGRNDDINWMVRELGLDELLFEPPPARPRQPSAYNGTGEDEEGLPPYLALPDPPALPNRRWTKAEAMELFDRATGTFASAPDGANYFRQLRYPLFVALNDLLGQYLNDDEIVSLFRSASWIVLCYAPRSTRPPEFSPENLEDKVNRQLAEIARWTDAGFEKASSGWLEQRRQPELMILVLAVTLKLIEKAPLKTQFRGGAQPVIIAALGAVMDTLDEAARLVP